MTTRLWTPADLAEGAVVWVVGDDERHVMDGDTFAIVHNRVGAPLAPYVATLASDRFGVGALNGRRVLSSSAAHVGSLTALGTRRAGIDAPGVTVVALQRQRETGSFREIVQIRWGNNSLWWNNASLQFYGLRAQTSDAASSASLSNVADGAWHLITATADWDGRRGELRLDGGRHVSTQPAATNSGRPVDASCHELLVGTAVGPTYRNDAQDIAELIVFARALSDDDIARVEGYLAHRWGLTASLPEAHAYKRVAPTVATLIPAPADESNAARQTYRAWLPNRAPAWLQRPNGKAWFWAHGDTLDSLEDAARVAVKARLPSHTTQDGLALLGSERRLERVPGESAESFARRVISAWTAWQHCGTPLGVLLALSVTGLDSARIHAPNGLTYSLDQDSCLLVEPALLSWPTNSDDNSDAIHPNWTIRAAPFWSEFELIILASAWRDPDTGDIILPNENDAAAQTIKRLVRQWKGAHCRCTSIIALKSEDAPLVGFPRRTIGTMAQSDGTNTGGLWTQNKGWFDRAPNDFRAQWTMNAQ